VADDCGCVRAVVQSGYCQLRSSRLCSIVWQHIAARLTGVVHLGRVRVKGVNDDDHNNDDGASGYHQLRSSRPCLIVWHVAARSTGMVHLERVESIDDDDNGAISG